jgi:hypothetical protein
MNDEAGGVVCRDLQYLCNSGEVAVLLTDLTPARSPASDNISVVIHAKQVRNADLVEGNAIRVHPEVAASESVVDGTGVCSCIGSAE